MVHRREELGGDVEVLDRIGDAKIAAKRGDQRVRGLERGLPSYGLALAAERVGDCLIEEERVVMASVDDELIAEAEQTERRERAHEEAERGHVILASSARPWPRMSCTAVSISTMASGPSVSGLSSAKRLMPARSAKRVRWSWAC